jgi:predicted nucleic acid-binding protein
LPKIFPDHETVGLARLQNDCLIALTARHTGTLLLAADGHFATIRRYVPFPLRILKP